MSASWKGKTYGGLFGYQLIIFILKYTGLIPTYVVLRFVSLYYVFFAPLATKSIFYYFNTRLKYSRWKSFVLLTKNYFVFAQTIVDKIAVMAGFQNKFKLDFEDETFLDEVYNNERGLVIVSAHVGNWALSSHLLNKITRKVNIVYYDAEHENIKNYLSEVVESDKAHVIYVKNDLSHIFEISNALSRNEIVCILGDRFLPGNKTIACEFLGENAYFPSGLYYIAASLGVPIAHIFTMKKSYFHYRLHFSFIKSYEYSGRRIEKEACIRNMADDYVSSLENIMKQYPEQWFNYYAFWNPDQPKTI